MMSMIALLSRGAILEPLSIVSLLPAKKVLIFG